MSVGNDKMVKEIETVEKPLNKSHDILPQGKPNRDSNYEIKLSSKDKSLLKKLDLEYMEQTKSEETVTLDKSNNEPMTAPVKIAPKPTVSPHHKSLHKVCSL